MPEGERAVMTRLPIAVMLALALAGCTVADFEARPKQTAGTVLGAIGGGVAGAQFGAGRGQLVATAAGTLIGAWLGAEIGASLDRADHLYVQEATYAALEQNPTGTASTWRNPDTGHYGAVTPTWTYRTEQGDCREFEQRVVIDGREEVAFSAACREPDGRWRII
jgi:surface antigen